MAFATPIPDLIERNRNGLLGKHPSWERIRLGDVVTVQNGSAFKSEYFNPEGRGMPLLRIRDVVRGATETWYDGPYDDEYVVHRGDLVIGMDGEFNHALWAGPPALLNQRVCRLQFRGESVTKAWVFHVLGGYLQAVNEETPSVTVKHLSSRTIADLLVPLPPRPEQDRIVAAIESTMSQVEAGVASFASASRRGSLYDRGVLQHALGDCVAPLDSGDRGSGLPDLPSTWEWSTVADEGVVQLGRMLNKDRSSGPHMRPYLRVANVLDDKLDLSDVKEMDFPPGEYERYLLHRGDILLNEGQSPELLGRPAMYRGERPGLCFQKTLLRFQAGPRVNPEFALLVFRHYLYSGRFRRESRITTGIGHLTQVRFAAMEFPVPPRAEQEKIVRDVRQQLDSASRFREVLAKTEEYAASLKASLLNAAFSGVLSREEVGDQPPEAHLAIIQSAREGLVPGVRSRRNSRRTVPVEEYS
jgi:type I restriction enzyme, S subunit